MAIDPRYVTSGIQLGRSLAPQRPPIQEMMALDMQRNQQIMDVMKTLLRGYLDDVSDMRRTKMSELAKFQREIAQAEANGEHAYAQALAKQAQQYYETDFSDTSAVKQYFNLLQSPKVTDVDNVNATDNKGGGFFQGARSFLKSYMDVPGVPRGLAWIPSINLFAREAQGLRSLFNKPMPGIPTFNNEQEALASGYKGIAIIGGRRARID